MNRNTSLIEAPMPHSYSPELESHYRQVYSGEASRYDRVRFGAVGGNAFNTDEQATAQALLGLRPGQSLLDVAAGTGRIAIYLAEHGLQVTALDLTRNMLEQARLRSEAAAIDGIHFVEGNGRVLPFANAQFDAVIAIRFLHLFPAALHGPFIQEMWRVLRPGGVLLVQFNSACAGAFVGAWGHRLYRWLVTGQVSIDSVRLSGARLYRRLRYGQRSSYPIWPYQLGQLFQGIENISMHGFWPIGTHLMRRMYPESAARLERFVASGRPSFFANHVFVRAVKPDMNTNIASRTIA
jgi:ubiquinone/menaquinone biosynthesis C-methylase UbiE